MDCSTPGPLVHGIFQARILEWVAIFYSRVSSPPRDRNQLSVSLLQLQVDSLPLHHLEALHPLPPYGIFAYSSNQLIELYIYSRGKTRGGV